MEEKNNSTQKNKIIFYTQKYKFIILTIFLLLITVGVTATGLYFISKDFLNSNLNNIVQDQKVFTINNVSLSDEQKQEIYKKILKRNGSILDNLNTSAESKTMQQQSINTDSVRNLGVGGSIMRDFQQGFSKNTTEYKIGNKECKAIFDKDNVYQTSKSVSLMYIDKDKFYTKYLYENPKAGLYDLTISNTDYKNKVGYNIYYKGGDYAVKVDYSGNIIVPEEMVTTQDSDTVPVDEQNNKNIFDYLGSDTEIVGETDYYGTRVYVIRYSDNVNCNDLTFTSKDKPNKVIYEFFVEQNEFSIVRQASYLDSISEDNLIYEVITSSETKNVNFEEVKNLFNFDANVEIKEFKEPKYNSEVFYQKQKDYFNSLTIHFLRPAEGNISNLYAYLGYYEKPEYQKYLDSREFFPKGKLGDKLYEDYSWYKKFGVNKILNYSMDVGDKRWNVALLDSKSIEEVIEKVFENNFDVKSIEKVNLKIFGNDIEATRIKYIYQVYSMPSAFQVEDENDLKQIGKITQTPEPLPKTTEYAFLFFYEGNLYEISVTNNNFDDYSEYGVDISNYSLSAFGKDTVEFKALSDAIFNHLGREPVEMDNVKVY